MIRLALSAAIFCAIASYASCAAVTAASDGAKWARMPSAQACSTEAVVMAAVAVPNIAGYMRQAKVRGATQQVASEIQTARNKAIVRNVNAGPTGGVVFAILDSNSYRFTVLDEDQVPPITAGPGLAPLRDLPQGLTFVAGTATPGVDFVATSGTLSFGASGTQIVSVLVSGDTCGEPNETFTVHLANPLGAVIGDADGNGTIQDDDSPPIASLTVGDALLAETNSGQNSVYAGARRA